MKVEQRTRALQTAQLEQVQQVYRFAELGHLSTALFHDLANHVMSVSIDIEGLQKGRSSDILARIQGNVRHIDSVVRRVQQQIRGQDKAERFNVVDEIQEVVKMLAYFSNQRHVAVEVQATPGQQPITYRGDLTRFRQVIINLLSNAIEAYENTRRPRAQRTVLVTVDKQESRLTITVTDFGKGISPAAQAKMFEPFYSTKDEGMGVGLFIVKKVIEQDFGGTISVSSNRRLGTTFVINLPTGGHGRTARNSK
jgi:signal transduction histidine kinase